MSDKTPEELFKEISEIIPEKVTDVTSEEITDNKQEQVLYGRKKKRKKRSTLKLVLLGVCLVVFLCCAVYAFSYFKDRYEAKKTYEQMQQYVNIDDNYADSPVDFTALQKENPDIYAWIIIPDMEVSFPVLQSPDDDYYYLNHNVDGTEGYPGSIYTEKANSKDFSDFNTIIYGHSMQDGTMFAELHKYEEDDFFDNKKQISIYTPEYVYYYDVFAAYIFDDRHILNNFDFSTEEQRQAYLNGVFTFIDADRSNFDDSIEVTPDDKIITLSTCIKGLENNRWLVQAVLAKTEKVKQ